MTLTAREPESVGQRLLFAFRRPGKDGKECEKMKIKLYYEDKNHPTVLDVPDEECTVMVETDYRQRLASASDKTTVSRRTVQEILDEDFNKPTFNKNHAETRRHASLEALTALDMEERFATESHAKTVERRIDLFRAMEKLQPQQRELLHRVYWEDASRAQIAREEGVKEADVNNRMSRIYTRLRKILNG